MKKKPAAKKTPALKTTMKNDYKYLINVKWSEDDQVFVAEVPELKTCATHGDTIEEAFKNAIDAIDSWIEGAKQAEIEIPEPLATKECSGRFVTRIDPSLHRSLLIKAKQEGKTLNGMVSEILYSEVG